MNGRTDGQTENTMSSPTLSGDQDIKFSTQAAGSSHALLPFIDHHHHPRYKSPGLDDGIGNNIIGIVAACVA